MKRFRQKTSAFLGLFASLKSFTVLLIIMAGIGIFTIFASLNTYELTQHTDLPLSDTLTTIAITNDSEYDLLLQKDLKTPYNTGSFGIPARIQMPESTRQYPITQGYYANGWQARKGFGELIITDNARRKVFGQAVIYLRSGTVTTNDVGSILVGDVLNITTDEEWPISYQVKELADDPNDLTKTVSQETSEIIVVLSDESSKHLSSFRATLLKLGERAA